MWASVPSCLRASSFTVLTLGKQRPLTGQTRKQSSADGTSPELRNRALMACPLCVGVLSKKHPACRGTQLAQGVLGAHWCKTPLTYPSLEPRASRSARIGRTSMASHRKASPSRCSRWNLWARPSGPCCRSLSAKGRHSRSHVWLASASAGTSANVPQMTAQSKWPS